MPAVPAEVQSDRYVLTIDDVLEEWSIPKVILKIFCNRTLFHAIVFQSESNDELESLTQPEQVWELAREAR